MPHIPPGKRLALLHSCGHLMRGDGATQPEPGYFLTRIRIVGKAELPGADGTPLVIREQPWPCRRCEPERTPDRIPPSRGLSGS